MTPQGAAGSRGVDAYLAKLPPDQRRALEALRKSIREAAPDAEEVLSYRMPAFRQNGILVYYAAFKDHCSFFPGSGTVRTRFAAELKAYAAGKGTVHFTPERPLPAALVKRIVRARVAENEARARTKGRAGSSASRRSD